MTIDPTAIHETAAPADVLAAFLPIVEAAFAEPWEARRLACGGWGAELAVPIDEEVWAVVAASYLMGPLMRVFAAKLAYDIAPPEDDDFALQQGAEWRRTRCALDAAALRLRDYWCQKRQETDR